MTFQHLVSDALDKAAAEARASHKYADALNYEAAKDMLIDDPAQAALDEIETSIGYDNRVNEWLASYVDDQINSMADTVLAQYCEHLLADPELVERAMPVKNVINLVTSVFTPEELRELAEEMEE